MHLINHAPANFIIIDGKKYDFFSGTSYLGLNQNPVFGKLLKDGLDEYGFCFGSSRNGNLQLEIYQEAEQKLAAFAHAPAALTTSSGMLAGQVVINYLRQTPVEWFYAPHTHSALWHSPVIEIPKINFQTWAEQICQNISNSTAAHCVICCNSVDALQLNTYHFEWANGLPKNKNITLIIDDSHGLGITGENGEGIYSKIKVADNVQFVVVSSLHKAMGIAGGVVMADADFLSKIRASAYFASCSPIAPAYLYAFAKSENLYADLFQKLRQNIHHFIDKVAQYQLFRYQENYPVLWTNEDTLYPFLLEQGIFIYSFAYPIQTGKPNTRIVLSAWHDTAQIEKLIKAIGLFFNSKKD